MHEISSDTGIKSCNKVGEKLVQPIPFYMHAIDAAYLCYNHYIKCLSMIEMYMENCKI